MRFRCESGRTMLEVIAVLTLGLLLALSGVYMWRSAEIKTRAQAVIKHLVVMKAQRQSVMATHANDPLYREEIGPYGTPVSIQTGTVDPKNKDYYWINVISSNSDFRAAIKVLAEERLEPCFVRNLDTEITFYFPKFQSVEGITPENAPDKNTEPISCPENAICDNGFIVSGCQDGFYGDNCDTSCGPGVAKCDNEGTPTQCDGTHYGADCSNEIPNSEGVESGGIDGLVCHEGYEGENCDPITCDSNATLNGSNCQCNAGYYGNGKTCTLCGDGQYSTVVGSTSCESCDDGYTHNAQHTGCEEITSISCDPGYVANQDNTDCICPETKASEGEECNETCGCVEGFKCDTENSQCVACQTGDQCGCEEGVWDADNGECVLICMGDTPKSCSNDTNMWCCASGEACSDTKNQCISGCEYSFEYPEITGDACVYELTSPTLTKIKGCTAGTYCYLRYSDNACNSWFTNLPKSGYIYGKCIGMTENETTITSQCSGSENGSLGCCDASEAITDMVIIKPLQSCSNGEYCYIRWDNNANLVNSVIGHFYGVCLPKAEKFGKDYLNINSLADEDRYNPWKI